MDSLKVVVGSSNPVKVDAVRIAFSKVWPQTVWEVVGVTVPSAVSPQPMSDLECIAGARNRARGALSECDAAYGVGLEGGAQKIDGKWFDSGWIVVVDREGREGIGSTIKMAIPVRMMQMIEQGMELGEVIDIIFQQQNSKQSVGHFGLMTNNALTRTSGYADGVISALARFIHPALFGEEAEQTH